MPGRAIAAAISSSKSARTFRFCATPMTRILWKIWSLYLGLNQLVTILMDLPLAAVRANSNMLRSVERENTQRRNRYARSRPVGVKCISRAIVRARRVLCKAAGCRTLSRVGGEAPGDTIPSLLILTGERCAKSMDTFRVFAPHRLVVGPSRRQAAPHLHRRSLWKRCLQKLRSSPSLCLLECSTVVVLLSTLHLGVLIAQEILALRFSHSRSGGARNFWILPAGSYRSGTAGDSESIPEERRHSCTSCPGSCADRHGAEGHY